MGTCFVAMPISTPPDSASLYKGDTEHFRHVLEHLFIPAITRAGLKPISPVTVGSAVVHAEIIRQITDSQLLLCDMTTRNANVFFELGIRTALDLPVCLVADTFADTLPFDLSLVNHHRYDPSLAPWELDSEVNALHKHIEATLESGEHNALWRVVGLKRRAETPLDPNDPVAARLELLENQVRVLADVANALTLRSAQEAHDATLIRAERA